MITLAGSPSTISLPRRNDALLSTCRANPTSMGWRPGHCVSIRSSRPFPNDVKNPDRLGRLERVAAILNASMPMQEVLPILLEAAIIELGKEYFGQNFQEFAQADQFPTLQKLAPMVQRYLRQEGGALRCRCESKPGGRAR
jgi:hypothetical protein